MPNPEACMPTGMIFCIMKVAGPPHISPRRKVKKMQTIANTSALYDRVRIKRNRENKKVTFYFPRTEKERVNLLVFKDGVGVNHSQKGWASHEGAGRNNECRRGLPEPRQILGQNTAQQGRDGPSEGNGHSISVRNFIEVLRICCAQIARNETCEHIKGQLPEACPQHHLPG